MTFNKCRWLWVAFSIVKGNCTCFYSFGQIDEVALEEMLDIVLMVKKEARFVCVFMPPKDIRIFLLHALDNGMLNGDWVFYGLDFYFHEGPVANPTYYPEVDMMTLYQGFISGNVFPVGGPEWKELQEQIIEGFEDPQFDELDSVTNPAYVGSLAGLILDSFFLSLFLSFFL